MAKTTTKKKAVAKRINTIKAAAVKAAKKVSKKPVAKAKKAAAKATEPKQSKKALLAELLKGKGATNTELCEKLGWQPHTLRAAISRIGKVEHSRVDGVTTYKLA